MERNISIIQEANGNRIVVINDIRFIIKKEYQLG